MFGFGQTAPAFGMNPGLPFMGQAPGFNASGGDQEKLLSFATAKCSAPPPTGPSDFGMLGQFGMPPQGANPAMNAQFSIPPQTNGQIGQVAPQMNGTFGPPLQMNGQFSNGAPPVPPQMDAATLRKLSESLMQPPAPAAPMQAVGPPTTDPAGFARPQATGAPPVRGPPMMDGAGFAPAAPPPVAPDVPLPQQQQAPPPAPVESSVPERKRSRSASGRRKSPPRKSPPRRRSPSRRRSPPRRRRSPSRRRSPPRRRSRSNRRRSRSKRRRSPSRKRRSPSRKRRSPSRRKRSTSKRKNSRNRSARRSSPKKEGASRRSPSVKRRSPSVKRPAARSSPSTKRPDPSAKEGDSGRSPSVKRPAARSSPSIQRPDPPASVDKAPTESADVDTTAKTATDSGEKPLAAVPPEPEVPPLKAKISDDLDFDTVEQLLDSADKAPKQRSDQVGEPKDEESNAQRNEVAAEKPQTEKDRSKSRSRKPSREKSPTKCDRSKSRSRIPSREKSPAKSNRSKSRSGKPSRDKSPKKCDRSKSRSRKPSRDKSPTKCDRSKSRSRKPSREKPPTKRDRSKSRSRKPSRSRSRKRRSPSRRRSRSKSRRRSRSRRRSPSRRRRSRSRRRSPSRRKRSRSRRSRGRRSRSRGRRSPPRRRRSPSRRHSPKGKGKGKGKGKSPRRSRDRDDKGKDDKGKDGKGDGKGAKSKGVELCGDFKRGNCTRGDKCRYSHGDSDTRPLGDGNAGGEGSRPGDWTCPGCGINVFASKDECFKCHTKRDGTKGDGKSGELPRPDKFSEQLWEQSRSENGLKLIKEDCTIPVAWDYILSDDNRRSYAAHLRSLFTPEQTKMFFQQARDGTEWKQPEGPLGPIPRKTAWLVAPGGCNCTYRYGRIEVEPMVYPTWLQQMMTILMPLAGITDQANWPNCCNANLYEDGSMSVGWHSDDEALFQGKFQDIRIISFSLGQRRKFELRANWPEEGERPIRTVMLGDGDLMTMEGMLQKHFQHRVPKEGGSDEPRINFTWRWNVKHTPRCPVARSR